MRDVVLSAIDIALQNVEPHIAKNEKLREQLAPIIEDLYILNLVDVFYFNKHNSFSSYIKQLSQSDLFDSSTNLKFVLDSFLKEIVRGINTVKGQGLDTSNILLIGDPHSAELMRYKVDKEIIFNNKQYYTELFEKIFELLPELEDFFPRHVRKGDFLFREFIPVNEDLEAENHVIEYYRNIGMVTSFVFLFRAIDLNAENLIINGINPIFFDMECIFSGLHEENDTYTIGNTGIIQLDPSYDLSAISGGTLPVQSYLKPFLTGSDSAPEIKWRVPSRGRYYNIPKLNNEFVKPSSYIKHVVDGFNIMSRKILKILPDIEKIVAETEVGTRTIVSPTRLYRIILQSYAFPQVFNELDIKDHSRIELRKRESFLYDLDPKDALFENEIDGLSKWLIPKFISEIHSSDIFDNHGNVVGNYKVTQYDVWKNHIKDMEEKYKEAAERISEVYSA